MFSLHLYPVPVARYLVYKIRHFSGSKLKVRISNAYVPKLKVYRNIDWSAKYHTTKSLESCYTSTYP